MNRSTVTDPTPDNSFPFIKAASVVAVIFGCLLRLFEITRNSFIFYDEGMYLNHNRELLEKIDQFPANNVGELGSILKILFHTALATAKWLWFFISNLRVFVDGADMFYFNRVVSCVFGLLTVGLTYMLARRVFRSSGIALFSAAILAVLPSHVFYSRLAMQESFSTFFFMIGLLLYSWRREISILLVGSALAFTAVYFTNYRMIVLPLLLLAFELVCSLAEKRRLGWRKYLIVVGIFLGVILGVGLINQGSNLFITTAWMGRQADLASSGFQILGLLSYPYTIFRLEGLLFGAALSASLYWFFVRDWHKFLPAVLVLMQIAIFTFASEKGARYLCVVLPLASMAVATNLHAFLIANDRLKPWSVSVLCFLFLLSLAVKAVPLVGSPQGYRQAAAFIKDRDPRAKVLTTQPLVFNLWMDSGGDVQPVPKSVGELVVRYSQGFRYLVLDPQAYVSWTASDQRFTKPLVDYLGFIQGQMPYIVKIPHLSAALLERFVFDHNEHVMNSILFLNEKDKELGAIYVYDLTQSLAVMQKVVESTLPKTGSP